MLQITKFTLGDRILNVLILELKIYCGTDKFYGRSKVGQYDEVKNRAPLYKECLTYHNDTSFT